MRISLGAIAAFSITSLTLSACGNIGSPTLTGADAESAVRNIAGTYQGRGDDNILKSAEYVITFTQSKASLIGLLTLVSKVGKLQTKLQGSVTTNGYTVNANGTCTGTVKGRVSPNGSMLSGSYTALKCGGTVHKGTFGADKVKTP
jgi:hypothetical protein